MSLHELRTHSRMSMRLSRLISRRQFKETLSNNTYKKAVIDSKVSCLFDSQNVVTSV